MIQLLVVSLLIVTFNHVAVVRTAAAVVALAPTTIYQIREISEAKKAKRAIIPIPANIMQLSATSGGHFHYYPFDHHQHAAPPPPPPPLPPLPPNSAHHQHYKSAFRQQHQQDHHQHHHQHHQNAPGERLPWSQTDQENRLPSDEEESEMTALSYNRLLHRPAAAAPLASLHHVFAVPGEQQRAEAQAATNTLNKFHHPQQATVHSQQLSSVSGEQHAQLPSAQPLVMVTDPPPEQRFTTHLPPSHSYYYPSAYPNYPRPYSYYKSSVSPRLSSGNQLPQPEYIKYEAVPVKAPTSAPFSFMKFLQNPLSLVMPSNDDTPSKKVIKIVDYRRSAAPPTQQLRRYTLKRRYMDRNGRNLKGFDNANRDSSPAATYFQNVESTHEGQVMSSASADVKHFLEHHQEQMLRNIDE